MSRCGSFLALDVDFAAVGNFTITAPSAEDSPDCSTHTSKVSKVKYMYICVAHYAKRL